MDDTTHTTPATGTRDPRTEAARAGFHDTIDHLVDTLPPDMPAADYAATAWRAGYRSTLLTIALLADDPRTAGTIRRLAAPTPCGPLDLHAHRSRGEDIIRRCQRMDHPTFHALTATAYLTGMTDACTLLNALADATATQDERHATLHPTHPLLVHALTDRITTLTHLLGAERNQPTRKATT